MKILELNQGSFSLKNIVIKFEELSNDELTGLQKKLYRIGSLAKLSENSFLAVLTIDELAKLLNHLENIEVKNELELIYKRHQIIWSGKNFNFDLTRKSIVYSIVNVTPDSFYDGNPDNLNISHILKRVESDLENGASVLELGGKSSRPGYADISPEEEWSRLKEPISQIRKYFPKAVLAVDTDEAYVMERVLEAGVDIINDIDGFDTADKLKVIEKYQPAVVAMNNGRAGFKYADNVYEALPLFFKDKKIELTQLGLNPEKISIDPGVGFFNGDSGSDSLQRVKTTELLSRLGLPVMIAISRKSFMGRLFNAQGEERLFSSLILEGQMVADGGRILRVHDVKETKRLLDAIEIYKEF